MRSWSDALTVTTEMHSSNLNNDNEDGCLWKYNKIDITSWTGCGVFSKAKQGVLVFYFEKLLLNGLFVCLFFQGTMCWTTWQRGRSWQRLWRRLWSSSTPGSPSWAGSTVRKTTTCSGTWSQTWHASCRSERWNPSVLWILCIFICWTCQNKKF